MASEKKRFKIIAHMNRFQRKTILITGASKGIGRATALAFAEEGGNIVINYNSSQREADELVKEIESMGSQALAVRCDISQEDEVRKMVENAAAHFGKIDILVNNAGIVKDISVFKRSVEDWRRTLDVNLIGQFLCIKYVSQNMLENDGGRIINIASTSAIYSFSPDIIDYDASKAGVIALTKNFAKALAPNILVNAIAPGWVNTDINKDLPNDFIEKEKNQIYLKRFAKPEEIAKIILFLGEKESNYITGSVIIADGGHD